MNADSSRFVLAGAAVVVTGAGAGIGAALATRFAADGARVVVNDLDADAARTVAARIDGLAFPADVADPAGMAELVRFARDRFGRIDLFCGNAGVIGGGGAEASDETWERTWAVNVMSHVHAARELLPDWLAAGRGRLLVTASAAGLLTLLGNAPYSVSKHAALAFAEWLRASYAHRGIVVQALCPQGVRTDMLARGEGPGAALLAQSAVSPEQVADQVVAALADDRFLVLPHPEVATYYTRRAGDPDRWLHAMNRAQQDLERPAED
ncbi:SDR family NAD(P)-dependent oxidoreductase [Plantactinospora soyae]|uniref:NAD(P)-dependent dehydrogenase (Short-subunit alcohol dehydrogenase family) n=1 Tax=Plantactinospora soyae TaxID=1544732 RepID=A0A927M7Z1_9ACTN|nr:SDR family oxidoreductase [Plantactinospora soyae]MBE1489843.1 NAD(P)-dependent dehydrogenase (short-subunit alcohol dehydrogenase family) [Plantactinospora soyae]